jgi:glutaredoxin 3
MGEFHVTLYAGPESSQLDQARRYLMNRRIQFEEKDIVRDPGARGELRQKTGSTPYPTIDVDGHVVTGFDRQKWDHLFRIREGNTP